MNDKQQFYNDFFAEMQKAMGLTDIHVSKDNRETDKGIPGINFYLNDTVIIPPLFPEFHFDMCKNGIPMEDVINIEKKILLEKIAEVSAFDIHKASPEEVTGKIRAAVVNHDSSKDWLKSMPHEKLLDLAVYVKLDFGDGYGIKVDNHMLTDLHLTKEEVFKIAKQNTVDGRELIAVKDLVLDYISEQVIDEDEAQDITALVKMPSYIFDNRDEPETDGAAVISNSGTLKQIHGQLDRDFYILPCSVEQVLIVPKSECESELQDLEKFMEEMSRREIPLQDQLSAQVYEFDGSVLRTAGENLTLEKDGLVSTITHHRSR